jgi:molybdopterin-biosynthesis enzyme MoeA-like protein
MVREKYEAYLKVRRIERVELTRPRVKMATLPEGTEPIPNPDGTAPGMIAKLKGTCIIALPGVPPEMEAIFNESLAEVVKKKAGKSAFFETGIYAHGIMESNLAPLIDKVMLNNPHVYVKSHVYTKSPLKVEGQKSHIELHFSTTAHDPETARSRLDAAVSHLSELVRKNGGRISK